MNGVTDYEVMDLAGREEDLDRLCDLTARINSYKKEIKRLEKLKEPIEKSIKELLENSDIGITVGYQVDYKRGTTHRFNSEKLKEEKPDIFERYYEERPLRRFSIKRIETAGEEFDF